MYYMRAVRAQGLPSMFQPIILTVDTTLANDRLGHAVYTRYFWGCSLSPF